MPKINVASKRRARTRASNEPYAKFPNACSTQVVLPDPKRPELAGTGLQKPSRHHKMLRKMAFLKSIGENAAAASVEMAAGIEKADRRKKTTGHGDEAMHRGLNGTEMRVDSPFLGQENKAATGSPGATIAMTSTKKHEQRVSNTIKTNAARQRVAAEEIERLKMVTSHPAFKAGPHAAIRDHLRTRIAEGK